MRNQRARRNSPTVIIQQAPATYSVPEVVERKPEFDPQQFMQQMGQMVIQQQTQQPRPQTLDVKEAAEYLRISAWSVYDMCRTKSLPFSKSVAASSLDGMSWSSGSARTLTSAAWIGREAAVI